MTAVPRTKPVARSARELLEAAKKKGEEAIKSGKVKPVKVTDHKAKAPAEPENVAQDLNLAALAIFDGGASTVPYTRDDGVAAVATIRPAKMKHIPIVMLFFASVVEGMDPSGLAQLVDAVVNAQKLAIARGGDPNNISLRELASEELVSKVFGHVSILGQLTAAAFKHLPSLVAAFTDMPKEDYDEIDPDTGMQIAGGIFLQNYRFFTQTLRPTLMAFMMSFLSRRAASGKKTA